MAAPFPRPAPCSRRRRPFIRGWWNASRGEEGLRERYIGRSPHPARGPRLREDDSFIFMEQTSDRDPWQQCSRDAINLFSIYNSVILAQARTSGRMERDADIGGR
ncbi:hypothetical protein KL86PLE_90353 [uncultured Pleomorphomonas sp.]|uniref:Uncharacterized protein n=1 Tax=uncultured Pleomorphomonas sp. TaxID=442121 RepID=A0A212LP80_9HYPH|nr:hypothetical protein KL86PLE_90353 [uncultured Pleomorphomonas sp.]